ncbi:tagatose-bisphosphate aldolase [Aeribacillus composti]|uniref:Tagatose 1,6-diphosphate aldolase n=1 Tax=Aeribacillus composti TaxID=1868734 RepID=A0ABY9WBP5_9BACI|nr:MULTISPECIES: tagatose-bisphosphate aldolase [Aeribacillus]KZM54313.1 tagatose-bisphosphate aldolase [Aeribacillus pallidus]MED0649477.1 tagatose-bisphosphate aldolase [Aeribacillus composti]MED4486830.1 tagatose-bisphosphate aldolase [Aeribacillus pallidus]TVZ87671.1 tagatose 1,6-diphosphate aldolase [Aeribacillus composti]WNF33373.1 tagatose-bisphosphate aldolase [Aeribacillus composti]
MLTLSRSKIEALERLSNGNHIIGALAIDQRGSLKKMIASHGNTSAGDEDIIKFKEIVSAELTPFSTSILLDPEYGLPASRKRNEHAGLILAYEKTGYDASQPGRLPDLLDKWSVKRLKEQGADAVKFLLYYDVDEDAEINEYKHVYIERIGSECMAEDIPFFLEIVTYDAAIQDEKGIEYAKVKPYKVIEAMKEFSKSQYHVDVLKVEVPVNMNFVEGFSEGETVYSREEALRFFKEQSEVTPLPFIFLSAGVSAKLFQETLKFAKEAGSTFNGVLCGRATWKSGVKVFANEGEKKGREWMRTEGRRNIEELNQVLQTTASSWKEKVAAKL